MTILPRQTSGGISPAVLYAVVGVVAAILVIVVAACLINRQRKIRKRARQRLNNARQWELTNLAPRRTTTGTPSIRSRQARQPLSAPHNNPSLYRDRPLPPVPIRTRTRPPNRNPTTTPPHHPASTRIPAAAAVLLDQGTASDGSALDVEPTAPVVNEVYARLRMEQDARFAELGYTESEAILASDTGLPSDDGVQAERRRQQEAETTRKRVVHQAAEKVAPTPRATSTAVTPARGVGLRPDDVKEEREANSTMKRPRSRSRGEPSQAAAGRHGARLAPPSTKEPTPFNPRARLTAPFQTTNPYVPPPHQRDLPAWKIEPPTPTRASASNATLRPANYDDVPIEESIDSSRFSQLDLGTSTEDGTYVSTDISDDPWKEEVRGNQGRWR